MGPKILTVDDSKTIRLIIGKAFKSFDCEVFEASNGVEGLAMASKERPDIIILDLTMPIMDGYETLTKLKSDPELKGIPVVMLTAEAGRENVLRIAKQGVRDYLVKPFKEEMIIDRVGRIIELKPKGLTAAKVRRFDDALTILVVDDKPAISEMIRSGLKNDTNWTVLNRSQTGEAMDYCAQTVPDLILISLSLLDSAGFNFFQTLRATNKTKTTPVFGLCVKTAVDDQSRAQQMGFSGIITKPIDLEDLKAKVTRALSLDTSYKYFQNKNDALVLTLPANFTMVTANEVSAHLRTKISEAVDSGIDKAVFDVSQVKNADINLIKLGLDVMQLCNELSLRNRVVGSEAISRECRNFEETKDWRFVASFEDALMAFNGKEAVQAA